MTALTDIEAPAPTVAPGPYFGIEVPFMEHIGLEAVSLDENSCHTFLNLHPSITNSRGDMHGGVLMSAFDFTLSAAARAHAPQRYGVVTIDMTTHFYAPARSSLKVIARCPRRGKSIAFCEGEIIDASGTLVAVARATFKLLDLQR